MIKKIFIDSDIIIDVETGRMPFIDQSKTALALIENGYALGVVESMIYRFLSHVAMPSKRAFAGSSRMGPQGLCQF